MERKKIPNTGDPLDVMNWAMTFGLEDADVPRLDGLHTSRVAALADELTALRGRVAELKEALAWYEPRLSDCRKLGGTNGRQGAGRVVERWWRTCTQALAGGRVGDGRPDRA